MRIKFLEEEIASAKEELRNLKDTLEKENRARTEEEKTKTQELRDKINDFSEELEEELTDAKAEKRNKDVEKEEKRKAAFAAGGPADQGEEKEKKKIERKYSFFDAYRQTIGKEPLSGVVGEMHEEAQKEARSAGYEISGTGVPSFMVSEKRADVDQTNSAIQGTDVGAYLSAHRQTAVIPRVVPSSNILEGLTSDVNLQDVNKQSVAWATAENAAAADGGANLSKVTLSPIRLTSKINVSKRLDIQNGPIVMRALMADVGRAAATKQDEAFFSTTDITNAPPSVVADASNTFTEAATYAAPSSTVRGTIYDDITNAIQTLANVDGAQGSLAVVANTKFFTDLANSPKVLNIAQAADSYELGAPLNFRIHGIPVLLTTSTTSNGTTSADFAAGDWSRAFVGYFGGMDMVVDPWTSADKALDRLLFHRWMDFALVQGEALVKATTLLS